MALKLKFIDRKKRLRNRFLEFAILTPIGLFFYGCFYRGRGGSTRTETLMEQFFDFEPYWRTVGIIGAPSIFIIYLCLDRILKYQKGHINLAADAITLNLLKGIRKFDFKMAEDVTIIKDLTYTGDVRNSSKVASKISFYYTGNQHQYEFQIETPEEQNELNELIDHWKLIKPELKVNYKKPFNIFNFR